MTLQMLAKLSLCLMQIHAMKSAGTDPVSLILVVDASG
jgi:hypothetical protein